MSLIYNALQKFNSALINLNNFMEKKDFYEIVSALDCFFSEFRNVTFVLEKSLTNADEKELYKKMVEKHLINDDMKWFVDRRNEASKEHPSELQKTIRAKIYYSQSILEINKTFEEFDIENWNTNFKDIIEEKLKEYCLYNELYISFEIIYKIKGEEKNIINFIKNGIYSMKNFLLDVNSSLNEIDSKDTVSELLKIIDDKIKRIEIMNMNFIIDYVYERDTGKLRFSERTSLFFDNNLSNDIRVPLKGNKMFPNVFDIEDMFFRFCINHLVIYNMQDKNIMPTFFIFYNDGTFSINSFSFSEKTTLYRVANELSFKIIDENISMIMFALEYYSYEKISDLEDKVYDERIKKSKTEFLHFSLITQNLMHKSVSIEKENSEDKLYVSKKLKNGKSNFTDNVSELLIEAFKNSKNNNEN